VSYSTEQIVQSRQMYVDGVPTSRIRAVCRMTKGGLYYWVGGGPKTGPRHLEPLPLRSPRARNPSLPRGAVDKRIAMTARLWRAAAAQVREIEQCLRRKEQPAGERERTARAIAVLAKTMRELTLFDERNKAPQVKDDDAGPRDIDEFRRELARRMDALVASRAGGGVSGES